MCEIYTLFSIRVEFCSACHTCYKPPTFLLDEFVAQTAFFLTSFSERLRQWERSKHGASFLATSAAANNFHTFKREQLKRVAHFCLRSVIMRQRGKKTRMLLSFLPNGVSWFLFPIHKLCKCACITKLHSLRPTHTVDNNKSSFLRFLWVYNHNLWGEGSAFVTIDFFLSPSIFHFSRNTCLASSVQWHLHGLLRNKQLIR